MRRLFFVAVTAMLAVSYTASAQVSVDKDGIEKKLAKLDADTQNEKKNIKAATWTSHAAGYFDAATAATSGLYANMDELSVKMMYGNNASAQNVEIDGEVFTQYSYPNFDAYFLNGQLAFWEDKVAIGGADAIEVAISSYKKAYEIDPKASKVTNGLVEIADYYKLKGGTYFAGKKFEDAADMFEKSFEVSSLPAVGIVDTVTVYNAGFLYAAINEYADGIEALEKALDYGYYSDGEIYFYIGHCYQGLEKYSEAKAILLEGITKYPGSSKIVEGLMSLYATTGEEPAEIIPYVEKAIASDPTNYVYYDGLGRIYDALGDIDSCLASFEKVVELAPNEFSAQFNLGMLYIRKANSMYDEIREIPNASESDYAEAVTKQANYFKAAVAPLELAYSIDPQSVDAVDTLKSLCFRLREEAEYMEKYNKYNEILQAM